MKAHIRRQLSVAIENEPARLAAVACLLAAQGIHIDAFTIIDNVEHGMVRLMTSDPDAAKSIIKVSGLPIVETAVLSAK